MAIVRHCIGRLSVTGIRLEKIEQFEFTSVLESRCNIFCLFGSGVWEYLFDIQGIYGAGGSHSSRSAFTGFCLGNGNENRA